MHGLGQVSRRRADVACPASARRVVSSGAQCGFSAARVRQSVGLGAGRLARAAEPVGASAGRRRRRLSQVAESTAARGKGFTAAGLGAFLITGQADGKSSR